MCVVLEHLNKVHAWASIIRNFQSSKHTQGSMSLLVCEGLATVYRFARLQNLWTENGQRTFSNLYFLMSLQRLANQNVETKKYQVVVSS